MTTDGLIPVPQAARMAHVHVTTVARWIRAGRVNAIKVGDGLRSPYLVDRGDIERVASERAGQLAAESLAIQAGVR